MSGSYVITIFVINIHCFDDYLATTRTTVGRPTRVIIPTRVATTTRIIIATIRIVRIIVLLRRLLLSLCSCLFLSLGFSFGFFLVYIINTGLITTNLLIDLIDKLLRVLFGIFKNKLLIILVRDISKKTIKTIDMLLKSISIFSGIYIKIDMVSYRGIPFILLSITTVFNNGIVFIKQLRPIRGSAVSILKTVIRDFLIQNLFIIMSIFNGIKTLLKS